MKSDPEKDQKVTINPKSHFDIKPLITLKQDEQLGIDIVMINETNSDYSRVDDFSASRGFLLDLYDEHNNKVQLSSFGKTYFSSPIGSVSRSIELLPKKTKRAYRIYIGRIFDLSNEGVYTLKIRKDFYSEKETIRFDGSTKLTIEDSPVIKDIDRDDQTRK